MKTEYIIEDAIQNVDNKMMDGTLYIKDTVTLPNGKPLFKKIGSNKILSTGSQIVACKMNLINYEYDFKTIEEGIVDSGVLTHLEDDITSYELDVVRIVGATTVDVFNNKDQILHPLNLVYCGIMLTDDGFDSGNILSFNSGEYMPRFENIVLWRASETEHSVETKENYLRSDYDLYVKNEVGAIPIYGYLMKKIHSDLKIVTPTGTSVDELNSNGITNLLTYIDFDITFTRNDIIDWCKAMYGDDSPAKFSSIILCVGLPMLHNSPTSSVHTRFKDVIAAHRVNISEISRTDNDEVTFKYRIAVK